MSAYKYSSRANDDATIAILVVWAIGALLTIALWGVVVWAIIQVVLAVTA